MLIFLYFAIRKGSKILHQWSSVFGLGRNMGIMCCTLRLSHVMSHVGFFMSCHMWGISCVVTCVVYHVLSHVWYIMSCHMCDISCVLCKDCHMSNNTWVQRGLMTRQHRTGQCSTIGMPQVHPLEPRHLVTLWVIVANHVLYAKIVTCWAACVTHGSGSMVMWACLARNLPFAPQPNPAHTAQHLTKNFSRPRSASNWIKGSFHLTLDLAQTGWNWPGRDRLGRFVSLPYSCFLAPDCWILILISALASIVNTRFLKQTGAPAPSADFHEWQWWWQKMM